MKLNFKVFKKGKPIYWVIGGIVIFVLFYMMFNKGAGSSGGITTVNSGPSDAAISASTQLALAQTQANAGVAMAQLQYNGQIAQTQAAADVAKYTAALDANTAAAALATQKAIAGLNAEYGIETARLAANTQVDLATIGANASITQWQINANILNTQMMTQAEMFSEQMKAATISTLAGQIGTVKANDRDNMLAALIASSSGQALNFYDPGHSIFQLGPAPA